MLINKYKLIRTVAAGLLCGVLALALGSESRAQQDSGCGCGKAADKTAWNQGTGDTLVDVAVKAGSFKTLVAAVKAAGLVDTLKGPGPFTVFAPTDEAFAKLPAEELRRLLKPENQKELQAILTYHVVPGKVMAKDVLRMKSEKTVNGASFAIHVRGDKVYVDNAQVVKTDIEAGNGIIHVIDSVLIPDMRKDIVDTAIDNGSFKTLVAALQEAGLVETLRGEGPFTVFAPTDAAFAKLPQDVLKDLLKEENKGKLQKILTYHVLAGEMNDRQVMAAGSAKTVNGKTLGFAMRDGNAYIGDAKLVKADIFTRNGVIHVIDTVLIPN